MAPGFHGSTHSIWGLPHAFGLPLTRVKSRGDSSPDTGAAEPSRHDTSTEMVYPVADGSVARMHAPAPSP
jgi:hypothetical protein